MTDLAGEALVSGILLLAFLGLLGLHVVDMRRRRARAAEIRATGDYGERAAAVREIIERAGRLLPAEGARLAEARRRAAQRDPRVNRDPAGVRRARDRAYANQRDVVGVAAAAAARDAALVALVAATGDPAAPPRPGTVAGVDRGDAALAAADAAAAVVAADRIPAEEFRLLTRAWREVIGPVGARPRAER